MKGCCVWDLAAGTNHSVFLADSSGMKPDIFYCGKQPGFVSILLSVSVWIELVMMFNTEKKISDWSSHMNGVVFFVLFFASFNSNYNDQKKKKMMGIYQVPRVRPVSWFKIQNSMNVRWKCHCTLRQGLPLANIIWKLKRKTEKREGYSMFPWNMATGNCLSDWPHGKQRLGLVWQAVLSIKDDSLHFVCSFTIKRSGDQDSDVSMREICYSARVNETEHTISFRG